MLNSISQQTATFSFTFITMLMAGYPVTLVPIHQTAQCYILQGCRG